jgi:hypothetical protein
LTWLGSQALEIEIDRAPDSDQRSRLKRIAGYVGQVVAIEQKELDRASELEKLDFSGFDAVHLACAESGGADIFLSTDDRLLKRAKRFAKKIISFSESFGLAEGNDLMNIQTMTPQQIRTAGMAALSRELGVVGMIRFMQQFEMGQGDYSKDRHQWLDQYSVADIAKLIQEKKATQKQRRPKAK